MTSKINLPIEDRTLTRKTILLVEDNRDDEDLTLMALRKCNIMNQVVVARDGEEALKYLFATRDPVDPENNTLPALVLLDLKLPKINGIEVLEQIRANPHTQGLPVMVITSSLEERHHTLVNALGAISYLNKPIDFEKLKLAVGHLGMGWVLFNEVQPAATVAAASL
jgi:two-component system response regulator